MWIDTHCHLDARSVGDGTAAELLGRARSAGVGAVIGIGVSGADATRETLALAHERQDVVATVGLHPHDAGTWSEALEAELERLAGDPRVVAVGEVGLDHHYDRWPRARQLEVFRRCVALARRVRKPLVIHTREAPRETLEVLAGEGATAVGGVIHCFSEDLTFARRALELGFDLSFSGVVTFKGARSVQEVAAWAPEDRILVETDAPYLAPVPLRGRRCEPAHVVHTGRRVAELRGVEPARLERATTENACRRFGPALAAAVAGCQTPG